MERVCAYRNCNVDITNKRKDAKYCSRNCKSCERKYKARRREQILRYSENEMKKVIAYKELMNNLKNN